jgi:hypothetical protein
VVVRERRAKVSVVVGRGLEMEKPGTWVPGFDVDVVSY